MINRLELYSDNGRSPAPDAHEPSPAREAIVIDLWGGLRRRWPLLLVCVFAGVALAVLYVYSTPVIYESTTEILVIPKDANLAAQSVQGQLGLEQPDTAELLATHMEIITSPRIVKTALDSHDLAALPSIVARLGETTDAVEYVIDKLQVQRGGEGGAKDARVLQVAFQHTSPEDCAAVLSAVVESYQDFLGETAKGAGTEAAQLIRQAKDDLQRKLAEEEANYRQFREDAPLLWSKGESQNVHQLRVAEWESALSQLRLKRTAVSSRLDIVRESLLPENRDKYSDLERFAFIAQEDISRLTLMVEVEKGDPLSEAFQAAQPQRAGAASAEFDRLIALKVEARSLSLQHGAQHPKVLEKLEEVSQLEDLLEQKRIGFDAVEERQPLDLFLLVSAYAGLLEKDLQDMDRQELEFRALIDAERQVAKSLVNYELLEESLSGSLARTQGLFDAVLERLREINLLTDYGGYITEVISPVEAGEKSWPRIPLLIVLGGLVGGVAGTALALSVELADTSFRNPDDVREYLQLPILTHLPTIDAAGVPESDPIDAIMVAHHRPKSPQAENVRRLRTSLYFHTAGKSGNVILITSALPGDGKTTVSTNLAVSLAQAGKRVLLVDADMRRPRAHSCFGLKQGPGLSDVLIDPPQLSAAVIETDIDRLSVLPAGTLPPNPAELLSMPSFGELVEQLRRDYDFILFDSPPVLAVIDPIVVSGHADGAVLTLRLTRDTRSTAMRAKEALLDAGVEILGLVINGLSTAGPSYGYRDYGYGYGRGDRYGECDYVASGYHAEGP